MPTKWFRSAQDHSLLLFVFGLCSFIFFDFVRFIKWNLLRKNAMDHIFIDVLNWDCCPSFLLGFYAVFIRFLIDVPHFFEIIIRFPQIFPGFYEETASIHRSIAMLRLVALGLVAGADLPRDPGDPGDLVAAEHSSETRQQWSGWKSSTSWCFIPLF